MPQHGLQAPRPTPNANFQTSRYTTGLVRWENNRLYSRTGLAKARDALKPGGILAVWSAAPDPAFRKRLKDAGLDVEERKVRSRPNNKGAHHVIWFAQKS